MNPNQLPVLQTLWSRRGTRDGRVALWGSAIQVPFAVALLVKGWLAFPQEGADELLMAALVHLAIPFGLMFTFVQRGAQLNFRASAVLTVLLVLTAFAPFAISLPLLNR